MIRHFGVDDCSALGKFAIAASRRLMAAEMPEGELSHPDNLDRTSSTS